MNHALSLRISESLDPNDPAPLYHQVAAIVRWEILHGRLTIGELLPPLREVAAAAGVNYHTVRRAWADLEEEGVITQRRGRGARVVRMPRQVAWSPAGPAPEADRPRVWVLADALGGAVPLAEHLAERWQVEGVPWPPEGGSPPPGLILALGGAAAVAGGRWPEREGDLRPIPLAAAPQTLAAIRRNVAILGARRILIIAGETDPAPIELLRQLPRLGLEASLHREESPGATLEEVPDAVVVYFPAAWRGLDWSARSHPRALAIELQWAAGRVAGVAVEQGWPPRER